MNISNFSKRHWFFKTQQNNQVFSIFICYPTIRISGTVVQMFIRLTTLLAVATYAISVGILGCYYMCMCSSCVPTIQTVQIFFVLVSKYSNSYSLICFMTNTWCTSTMVFKPLQWELWCIWNTLLLHLVSLCSKNTPLHATQTFNHVSILFVPCTLYSVKAIFHGIHYVHKWHQVKGNHLPLPKPQKLECEIQSPKYESIIIYCLVHNPTLPPLTYLPSYNTSVLFPRSLYHANGSRFTNKTCSWFRDLCSGLGIPTFKFKGLESCNRLTFDLVPFLYIMVFIVYNNCSNDAVVKEMFCTSSRQHL